MNVVIYEVEDVSSVLNTLIALVVSIIFSVIALVNQVILKCCPDCCDISDSIFSCFDEETVGSCSQLCTCTEETYYI